MIHRVNRRQRINNSRLRHNRTRRSMVVFALAAVMLLIGAYLVQRHATIPTIVQAISESEMGTELLPLADPIKPLRGEHDMSKIPSSPPQPGPVKEDESVPQVQVPVARHDFGEIPVSPSVAYVYAIQNVGTEDLHISNLVTSCGCTTAELSTRVIPPGYRADLKVVFDPGFHETVGPVTRLVWMITNDPTQPWLEVVLTADVLPAP